ncbi:S1 family peptidase [Micromonospora sp. WMMD812]|uniref:S1 family peptidase n=1 Tax=Micromonospora sp. WMMD812 TaxID=3015152 RepID=UPI00248BC685|nr:S1 family peptidase [Micromonospora sp. WMMD812]WBB68221.1 S1 family peptidase [Micromonospora sp. WMMD812]
MRHTRNRLRTVSVLALAAIGASMISGVDARAISGVTPVPDGTHLFTASLRNDVRGCSGALIDQDWIITAKSCFAAAGETVTAGPPAHATTVALGKTDLAATGGHTLAVTTVLPHPTRNVAVAQLERRVTDVQPVALGAAATAAEELRAVGFGRSATEWVPDKLHAGTFTVQSVTAEAVAIDGSASGASLCKGDAGGPLLRDVAGTPRLVAVHDRAWQGGCLSETETRRTAVETRVDDLGAWITESTGDGYVALSQRGTLLDTRTTGGVRPGGSTMSFPVLGVAGVPATGVKAVLVDVTTISPTANTYLTVYPEGSTRPATSSVNASTGETISTTLLVRVGPTGNFTLYNHAGSTHAKIDVHGYVAASGGGVVMVPHTRVVDTRDGTGTTAGTVPTNGTRTLTLTGGVIPAGATSALLDVAVVGATGGGYLAAYPAGGAVDNGSVLDYVSGVTSQGIAVKLSADGKVTIVNRGPAVHLVISLQGYVAAASAQAPGLRAITPVQVIDTRANGGAAVKARGELFVQLSGANGIPLDAMEGAVISVTVVGPTTSGYLTVEPVDRPFGYTKDGPIVYNPSVANFAAGQPARTTTVFTKVGPSPRAFPGGPTIGSPGKIRILNVSSGTVHLVVSVHGWVDRAAETVSR